MATSSSSERVPRTPATTRLAITPGSRVLKSPISEEIMWKRLKEAGFDEQSIKKRDKAALIAYIAKLESEVRFFFFDSSRLSKVRRATVHTVRFVGRGSRLNIYCMELVLMESYYCFAFWKSLKSRFLFLFSALILFEIVFIYVDRNFGC